MNLRPAPPPVNAPYRGRFAPSPTGPLHFGSLVAALGSYLEAKAQDGEWHLRMEDLDRPREVPGAARAILTTLEAFGFAWDDSVLYQSQRTDAYAAALHRLGDLGLLYACACSRREIAAASIPGLEGPLYPGTCRTRALRGRDARAIRLRIETPPISFRDQVQGLVTQDLITEVGDFILRRADGLHAYQLAVVVDDALQGISHVVRGADLTRSTPRQILLQHYLGLPTPVYAHLPLALDSKGRKLSKSDAAAPVDSRNPVPTLLQAWAFLGQPAFAEPPLNPVEFWDQALTSWCLARVPPAARRPPAQVHPK
ncbi:MAG: tRNA glutamyl-Q(34) synthetase GluQRS [Chromatiaceae bacterium]